MKRGTYQTGKYEKTKLSKGEKKEIFNREIMKRGKFQKGKYKKSKVSKWEI